MSLLGPMRLLQALSNGTISSAQLTTLLDSDVGVKNDWLDLTIVRSQMNQMAWRPTAMAAVIDSPTAMAAVADSPTAMAAVADSPTAKMAFYNSDIALTACLESAVAHSALVNAATLYTKNANGTAFVDLTTEVSPSSLASDGKYLVLGAFARNDRIVIIQTRRDGSIMGNQMILGSSDINDEKSRLCCPVASPLQFTLNGAGTNPTSLIFLRCDA